MLPPPRPARAHLHAAFCNGREVSRRNAVSLVFVCVVGRVYLFHRREKVARLTLSPTTDAVIEYHRLYRCPDSMTVGCEKKKKKTDHRGCQSESLVVKQH